MHSLIQGRRGQPEPLSGAKLERCLGQKRQVCFFFVAVQHRGSFVNVFIGGTTEEGIRKSARREPGQTVDRPDARWGEGWGKREEWRTGEVPAGVRMLCRFRGKWETGRAPDGVSTSPVL